MRMIYLYQAKGKLNKRINKGEQVMKKYEKV